MEAWQTLRRPCYLGKYRDSVYKMWDGQYGKSNWRLVWKVNDVFVGFLDACALYEDAYLEFFMKNPDVTQTLISEACNVYDDELSNINSVSDYSKQETARTHIQDIAIRRCLIRMGLWFNGTTLIRIRQEQGNHPLSMVLSPGRVPFHKPELIEAPENVQWWQKGTVESFYQNNRFLQVRAS